MHDYHVRDSAHEGRMVGALMANVANPDHPLHPGHAGREHFLAAHGDNAPMSPFRFSVAGLNV